VTAPAREVRVGIIGLGVMGWKHAAAYAAARTAGLPNRVVAVADHNPGCLSGPISGESNVALSGQVSSVLDASVRLYPTAEDLLQDRTIDLVSICTHTDTHVDVALMALAADKHVLVEKPVSTDPLQVRRLAVAAQSSHRLIMPAMCMRFWPGWTWLKDRTTDGALGRIRGITFTRLGSGPRWSPQFYANPARTGGALFDLHIHDSDFIFDCFGLPARVTSSGTIDHLTTIYHYDNHDTGPAHIVAEGGWDHTPGFPFQMRFTAIFEHATADFDINRATPLMLARNNTWEPIPIPAYTGYDGEVRHMLAAVIAAANAEQPRLGATLADAVIIADLLCAERQSLQEGRTIALAPAPTESHAEAPSTLRKT